jgi:hypothetical protein
MGFSVPTIDATIVIRTWRVIVSVLVAVIATACEEPPAPVPQLPQAFRGPGEFPCSIHYGDPCWNGVIAKELADRLSRTQEYQRVVGTPNAPIDSHREQALSSPQSPRIAPSINQQPRTNSSGYPVSNSTVSASNTIPSKTPITSQTVSIVKPQTASGEPEQVGSSFVYAFCSAEEHGTAYVTPINQVHGTDLNALALAYDKELKRNGQGSWLFACRYEQALDMARKA